MTLTDRLLAWLTRPTTGPDPAPAGLPLLSVVDTDPPPSRDPAVTRPRLTVVTDCPCGKPIGAKSPSADYCSEGCQTAWQRHGANLPADDAAEWQRE
jgi:hypothetical protein